MQATVGSQANGVTDLPRSAADVSSDAVIARTPPRCFAVALLACALTPRALAASLAVPLALEETAGVVRHAFPSTASVPLPQGRVRSTDALWLETPDNHAALLQARALQRWPDGSVRWLLLDFLADVPADARVTYTLRDGKPAHAAAAPRLRVTRGDSVTLDAGVLRAEVPGRGRPLLAELRTGDAGLGAVALPLLAVDGAGGPPTPAAVRVETEGPVRTEVLLTGRYPSGLA